MESNERAGRKLDIVLSIIIIVLVVIACILSAKLLLKYLSASQLSRSEWAFECTEIVQMNLLGYWGANVTIAIIDTGINLQHDDLKSMNLVAWRDFVNGKEQPYDDNGHGTHIAGILAANGKIKGIAHQAKFIIVKSLKGDGSGDDGIVANAIEFCIDPDGDGNLTDGADVICLSLGGKDLPKLSSASERACQKALDRGVFVVAAAGNNPKEPDIATPGTVELVISVGAIDSNKKIADFSQDGNRAFNFKRDNPNKKPELVAPGVEILSTWGEWYAYCNGTSQSAPFVAGVLALILDALPQYQHEQTNNSTAIRYFKQVLADSAEKLDEQNIPHDNSYGYGLVQVLDAYLRITASS
ncbi:MAG: S8 family serine peptidase [Candidatus Thermoplasmatota archaeon]|nr:S8 family serine peptidase [Candidatus Thermoplasmatota archaeon]